MIQTRMMSEALALVKANVVATEVIAFLICSLLFVTYRLFRLTGQVERLEQRMETVDYKLGVDFHRQVADSVEQYKSWQDRNQER